MTFAPAVGELMGGRFELRARLDSGGFATVWRAVDRTTGDTVAVKCGDDSVHDRDETVGRFERELACYRRFDGALSPKTFPAFLDGAATAETAFVATELIDGPALANDVNHGGLEPGPALVGRVGLPVARLVEFLHRNGLLYLDLKPDNVLLRPDGSPVVVDYNTVVDRATTTDVLFYSDPFKPPELTPDDLAETRATADVFSLGHFVAYLLTGRQLGADEESRFDVDPRDHGGECSGALAGAVETATARRPERRQPDAAAFHRELVAGTDRDASVATLVDRTTGVEATVVDGTCLGRRTGGDDPPALLIEDERQHVSPRQFCFEHTDGDWHLVDTSVNGTYVEQESGWEYLLSSAGRERRAREDALTDEARAADARTEVADGTTLEPVSRDYGYTMMFETTQ